MNGGRRLRRKHWMLKVERPIRSRSRRLGPSIIFLAAVLFSGPAEAQTEKNPSGLQIFDAAIAKFEADRTALRQWQYHQTLTTQQFDRSGNIVARGTWHSIVRPGDPGPLEYTGKSVEGHLSFFDSGAEQQQTGAAKSQASASSGLKKEKNQTEWAIAAVRRYRLRERYDWKRMPDAMAAGEEAYVVAFTPKPNQNMTNREERFFNLLSGRMWISKRDFTVLRAEGALQSPCSLFWVIARVTEFRFTYRVEQVYGTNRLLRLTHATATTVVSFPFYKVRQKHWLTVDKYEPRMPRKN